MSGVPVQAPRAPAERTKVGITLVSLADEILGFRIEDVREIVTIEGLTPLFRLPPHILGILNLRGQVLPVAHLSRLLGLASSGGNRGVVVAPAGGTDVATFLVDDVVGIRWVSPSAMVDVPPTVEENRRAFFEVLIPGSPAALLLRTAQLFDPVNWCVR